MTELIIALIMQFGVHRSDGVVFVNNNGIDKIKLETGIDLKLVQSDNHYRVLPSAVGVGIVQEDQNGGRH